MNKEFTAEQRVMLLDAFKTIIDGCVENIRDSYKWRDYIGPCRDFVVLYDAYRWVESRDNSTVDVPESVDWDGVLAIMMDQITYHYETIKELEQEQEEGDREAIVDYQDYIKQYSRVLDIFEPLVEYPIGYINPNGQVITAMESVIGDLEAITEWRSYMCNTGYDDTSEYDDDVVGEWAWAELVAMRDQDGTIHTNDMVTQGMIDWATQYAKDHDLPDDWSII